MSRQNGKIKKFFADKGYGFISTDGGDIFFHVTDSSIDANELALNVTVSYEEERDRNGKTKACKLEIVG
ncbi:cold-shock protein [Candidatus Deianiraea vastatrix]|uniref:Cold shock-like protein CspA n=1 Tax=Candidatus Deianiraea vastatrix TaxID=2163644 RepID=A0A5B8XIC0_9RICK|nr:cold shock domain-containing protein [Candidatus Deianiraea vastatrix]QED23467.1 Putative cold shock protein [Candidatus Deianiraea vastatrix]